MVIDMHVHLPRQHWHAEEVADVAPIVEEMLAMGRKAGIDTQVLLALGDHHKVVRGLAHRYPDRLVPFMRGSCIDPDGPALLEKCVHEYGFKGVKLHEELPFWPLSGLLACYPLFRKASELDVPVVIHSWHTEEGLDEILPTVEVGSFPMLYASELGRRYPETTFILAHAGGMWVKAFQAAQPYPNICFDVSGFDPERGVVEKAVEVLGAERIFFGSDAPGRNYVSQLAKVQYADISDKAKRLILGENAARLLKMR